MTKGPVLIIGARSDIARAVARSFAALGHPIQLAARRAAELADDRADIELRFGVPVSLHELDVLDSAGHQAFVDGLPCLPQIAVCAVALMGNHAQSIADPMAALTVIRTTFEGPASIIAVLANRFEARGSGTIIGISSVAGERGRASNYVYGAAKAGLTAFLSGLRNRLSAKGVQVITVLPGFVATSATDGMTLPPALTASPDEVAAAILRAIRKGQDVIHVRRIWWPIMVMIRLLPESLFKRTKL